MGRWVGRRRRATLVEADRFTSDAWVRDGICVRCARITRRLSGVAFASLVILGAGVQAGCGSERQPSKYTHDGSAQMGADARGASGKPSGGIAIADGTTTIGETDTDDISDISTTADDEEVEESLASMMGTIDEVEAGVGWELGPIDAAAIVGTDLVIGMTMLFTFLFDGQDANPCVVPNAQSVTFYCFTLNNPDHPAAGSGGEDEYNDTDIIVGAPKTIAMAGSKQPTHTAYSVTNVGSSPSPALDLKISVLNPPPSGLLEMQSGAQGCKSEGTEVECPVNPLQPGQTSYFDVETSAEEEMPPYNSVVTATASSQSAGVSDTKFAPITVVAGPVIATQEFPDDMSAGNTYTDTVTVQNLSQSKDLAVTVRQQFSPQLDVVSASSDDPAVACSVDQGTDTVTCTTAQVDPAPQTDEIDIRFQAGQNVTGAHSTVTVTGTDGTYSTVRNITVAGGSPSPPSVTYSLGITGSTAVVPDPASVMLPTNGNCAAHKSVVPQSSGSLGSISGSSKSDLTGSLSYSSGNTAGKMRFSNVDLSRLPNMSGNVTFNYTAWPFAFPPEGTVTGTLSGTLSENYFTGTIDYNEGSIGKCTWTGMNVNPRPSGAASMSSPIGTPPNVTTTAYLGIVPTGQWINGQQVEGGHILAAYGSNVFGQSCELPPDVAALNLGGTIDLANNQTVTVTDPVLCDQTTGYDGDYSTEYTFSASFDGQYSEWDQTDMLHRGTQWLMGVTNFGQVVSGVVPNATNLVVTR